MVVLETGLTRTDSHRDAFARFEIEQEKPKKRSSRDLLQQTLQKADPRPRLKARAEKRKL